MLSWTLLIVVGLGPRPDDDSWVGLPAIEAALALVILVLALLGLVILVWSLGSGKFDEDAKRPGKAAVYALLVVGLFVALALSVRPGEPLAGAGVDPVAPLEVGDPVNEETEPRAAARRDLLGGGLLIVLAGVAILWARRHRAGDDFDASPRGEPESLAAAVERARQTLLLGDDPRSAVLAAYAEIEIFFEERGEGRRSTETAAEHVRRLIGTSPILADPEPLVRLADLYEVARFSEHLITAREQAEAAGALEQVRVVVRGASS